MFEGIYIANFVTIFNMFNWGIPSPDGSVQNKFNFFFRCNNFLASYNSAVYGLRARCHLGFGAIQIWYTVFIYFIYLFLSKNNSKMHSQSVTMGTFGPTGIIAPSRCTAADCLVLILISANTLQNGCDVPVHVPKKCTRLD